MTALFGRMSGASTRSPASHAAPALAPRMHIRFVPLINKGAAASRFRFVAEKGELMNAKGVLFRKAQSVLFLAVAGFGLHSTAVQAGTCTCRCSFTGSTCYYDERCGSSSGTFTSTKTECDLATANDAYSVSGHLRVYLTDRYGACKDFRDFGYNRDRVYNDCSYRE